jgi:hypothetical protein
VDDKEFSMVRKKGETAAIFSLQSSGPLRWPEPSSLPWVRGDHFQLIFCVRTILSYLLRFVPEKDRIDFRLEHQVDDKDALYVHKVCVRRASTRSPFLTVLTSLPTSSTIPIHS